MPFKATICPSPSWFDLERLFGRGRESGANGRGPATDLQGCPNAGTARGGRAASQRGQYSGGRASAVASNGPACGQAACTTREEPRLGIGAE